MSSVSVSNDKDPVDPQDRAQRAFGTCRLRAGMIRLGRVGVFVLFTCKSNIGLGWAHFCSYH